ncbi:hypothetical protein M8C21_009111, partial [Ambrosia artemisiifolia]
MKQNLAFIQGFLFFFVFFSNGRTTITVVNDCRFTVWPAISGSPDLNITGFELTEGNSLSLQPPANWTGRLWGRTGCTFNGSGHWSCKIGDCGSGEMECNGRSATPPVTIAQFDINTDSFGMYASYDVSLMDGYNLPMTVEPIAGTVTGTYGCTKRGCSDDLNKRCPEELMLKGGGGCHSPCHVFGTPKYCCNHTCEPTSYSQLFTAACPRSDNTGRPFGFYDLCDSANYTVRFCPSYGAFSTIKAGSQLNNNDQLVSINGKFVLGFHEHNIDEFYLGIWYAGDDAAQRVWVANPSAPIVSRSYVLSINPNTGNLIIAFGDITVLSITNVQAGPTPNVTATLEDNGNFRLINESNKRVLWQSFDHPTNVLLPGMKLGYDTRTRQNWTLTSWLGVDTFESGTFTLSWEPINETSQRLMIQKRGQAYWTSGFLDVKTSKFMFLLNKDTQFKYNFTSVYNNEERYFSFIPDSEDPFPMWILTPKGQITNYNTSNTWTPKLCPGYNPRNGCLSPSFPACRREEDYFTYRYVEFTSQTIRNSTDSSLNISISDCFVKCWNDCICVGFNSSNTDGTGCVIWTGTNNSFVDGGDHSTMKYVITFQSPDNPNTSQGLKNKTKKNMKQIWALIVVPLFLGLGLLWYIKKQKQKRQEYMRRKRDEYFLELAASESFKDVHQLESDARYGDLLLFSFASIMTATNDFSPENKLGQGGFGPVYK